MNWQRIKKWYAQKYCRHVFTGADLQARDVEGFVTWPCRKCAKVFRERCGLDMGKHGKLTGPWGSTKENID